MEVIPYDITTFNWHSCLVEHNRGDTHKSLSHRLSKMQNDSVTWDLLLIWGQMYMGETHV